MNRRFFNIAAVVGLLFPICLNAQFRDGAYGELFESETVAGLRKSVRTLSAASLEGRAAGSEGEKEAAVYFAEALESRGVDVLSGKEGDLFGIRTESGDTLTSRNVLGFIPGYDKSLKNHYIVIGARLDNMGVRTLSVDGKKVEKVFPGANGNASGLAMLLSLAGTLSTNRVLLRRSVIIAAFGSSAIDNAGSWYFLNRSFKDVANIDAMINLDMVGTGASGFYAYTSSNADMNAGLEAVSGTLQPVKPRIVSREPVRSDHRSFYAASIPSVFFTTGMYPEYNTDRDTESIIDYGYMERELEYVYNYTLHLTNGAKPHFLPDEDRPTGGKFKNDTVPYSECDRKPTFLGSDDPAVFLKKWVYVYLKYPQEAVEKGIQGRVLVDFTLDEKGRVRDVNVARGCNPLLDKEAVRVIEASPDWKPAYVRGRKVKCGLSLFVEFRLERKKNR